MSLFDIIRYTISNNPTSEQLRALPTDLLLKWSEKANFGSVTDIEFLCHHISEYYRDRILGDKQQDNIERINDIALLRKMIKEYDEPI